MAKQDDFVKTALRIPRDLHSQIQEAAAASGRSMNAEMIGRLQADVEDGALLAILDRLRESDDELLATTKKQRDLLWTVVDRTGVVLSQVEEVLQKMTLPDEDVSTLRQGIQGLNELINTLKAHR
jgi:hypothetical protein